MSMLSVTHNINSNINESEVKRLLESGKSNNKDVVFQCPNNYVKVSFDNRQEMEVSTDSYNPVVNQYISQINRYHDTNISMMAGNLVRHVFSKL